MPDAWVRAALCRRFVALPWLWDEAGATATQAESMKTVCDACPVLQDCDAHVRQHGITSGFWAGAFRTSSDRSNGIGGAA
jgi:hypothetical protein